MRILITGVAGFIGFHLTRKLLINNNIKVFGIDNLNSYYDKKLKIDRLNILKKNTKFNFKKIDISNDKKLETYFKINKIEYVVHLAAQAGVRYSILNPRTYLENNIDGFFNIIDISKTNNIKHFMFASTSSVYGAANKFPLKENFSTSNPLSFYAASKKSNEVLAFSYSNIHKLSCTGLRFFTVYGPYGRPDMSLYKFVDAIFKNQKLDLYNYGNHIRDFTHVYDVVDGIVGLIKKPSKDKVPFDVFNIASAKPKELKFFLSLIEKSLNKKAKINYKKMQSGDVHKTHGSIFKIKKHTGYSPKVNLKDGINEFVSWYKDYYK
tara:strand:- start:86 stop:1051 length:966 start_codon:yes stop_codon:yes gene_type:complete